MIQTGEFRGFEVSMEDPGILVVTFNRPDRLNGMDAPMKRDLLETLTQAAMEDSVRVVLFTGSGRAFSAGDDISGQDKGRRGEALVRTSTAATTTYSARSTACARSPSRSTRRSAAWTN